ncbi:MAG: hypothetical protein OXI86_06480, partial [Candidatus Poribacteria bacterium]|nr:hypothetical protein [Candidatus Poribacteria bacterium]
PVMFHRENLTGFPCLSIQPFYRRLLILVDGDFHRALRTFEQASGFFAQVEGFGDLMLNPGLDFFGEYGEVMCFHDFSMSRDFP